MSEFKLYIKLHKGEDCFCVNTENGLNEKIFKSKGEAIGFIVDWWNIHDR